MSTSPNHAGFTVPVSEITSKKLPIFQNTISQSPFWGDQLVIILQGGGGPRKIKIKIRPKSNFFHGWGQFCIFLDDPRPENNIFVLSKILRFLLRCFVPRANWKHTITYSLANPCGGGWVDG